MAFLLVGVGNGVRNVAVLGNGVLNGMGANPSAGVAVGPVDNALASRICA